MIIQVEVRIEEVKADHAKEGNSTVSSAMAHKMTVLTMLAMKLELLEEAIKSENFLKGGVSAILKSDAIRSPLVHQVQEVVQGKLATELSRLAAKRKLESVTSFPFAPSVNSD